MMHFTKAGGKGPVPVNVDDVKRLIEEVAYEGSHIDTILVCSCQVMYYPTKIGTMIGHVVDPRQMKMARVREAAVPGQSQGVLR